jgi:protein-disulfide isomerase
MGSPPAVLDIVPVSLYALPVYLAAIVLLFQTTIRWKALLPVALIVLGAALWFVGLQAFALRAFCKFCMAAHIAGGLAALILLRNNPLPANLTTRLLALAAAPVALLVIGQVNSAPRGPIEVISSNPRPQTNNPPAVATGSVPSISTNAISPVEARPDRTFSFIDGEFSVDLTRVPVSGRIDAPRKMVKLFDYTCHHCRDLHHLLKPVKLKYASELAVISLPVPLDANCNSIIKRTSPAHANACEYARMALAVFIARADKFDEFSDWLFVPQRPPTLDSARLQAENLVGKEAFAAALNDPRVEEQIRTDVKIYMASSQQAKRGAMPQLLFAHSASVGAISSVEVLERILFRGLGLGEGPAPDAAPATTNSSVLK